MTEQAWTVLTELEQPATDGHDFARGEALAAIMGALDLPDTLVNHMSLAVSIALQHALERGNRGTVRLTVLTQPTANTRNGTHGGWGFFLVEKPPDEARPEQIELFLFREAS
jgi:hypothetical protein